jgi:hypothetical protein
LADSAGDSLSTGRQTNVPARPDPRASADRLFASSTVVDLLSTFCREPDRRFYVNELIRRTGRFPRSIQLALATLEGIGLVSSERQANSRYYQVVRDHLFYPELASLMAKVFDVQAILARALRDLPAIRVAFVRPRDPDSSDLELVVIGDDSARNLVEAALKTISLDAGKTIRPIHFSADEWVRQARRERSYVRWLLEETHTYVVGNDHDLPE